MKRVKAWLIKYFIPHIGNAYRPHFLLGSTIRHLLGVVVGIELLLFALPTFQFANFVETLNLSAVLPGILSALTNEERLSNNLPQLSENPLLARAAELKAEDMASKGYFAHTSPEGRTPWYWFNLVGYPYSYAGENLAVNFSDSQDVTHAWMNSPTHRANIIGRNYREIGTGMATGTYKGRESVFVAQLYASPRILNNVAGAAPAPAWGQFLVSPHQSVNAILLALLAVTLAALVLKVFIKFDRRHADLIGNAFLFCLVIAGLYYTNGFLANRNVETSFMAFEAPRTQDPSRE